MKQKQSTIKNQESTDIAIIGGGMVGLAQAIALAQEGFSVAIIDRDSKEKLLQQSYDGRVSAIAWKSVQLLKQIDAWKFLEKFAQPINDIRVSDGNSLLFTHFDHREISSEIGSDPFGYMLENRHLRIGLFKRAEELENLKLLAPEAVKEVRFAEHEVELESGRILQYQLLIAADGKFSKTREAAGVKISKRDYRQTGIVCSIEHELPHEGLAHEKFLPAGPFAVLPMQGNFSALVWTEPTELAPIYMGMSDVEFLAEIEKRCSYLGKIKLTEGRWAYPLVLTHAEKYTGQDLVLIGDAAHGIHPIAGQGVNLGYRDVIDLTALLVEKKKLGLRLASALPEYEKLRRIDNSLMIFVTDVLNRLFSNNITPIRIARDLGLGVVNEIPLLKRFFMKAASGRI